MEETLRSELAGTAGLTIAAFVSMLLTLFRRPVPATDVERRQATRTFVFALSMHALHFGEELATRFYDAFPAALGLAPWPTAFFLTFNLTWLVIFIAAACGLRAGMRVAFFPAWFLSIAAIVNGIAHPLLALLARGYFSGLLTSPLVGIAGVVLWKRLVAGTTPKVEEVE